MLMNRNPLIRTAESSPDNSYLHCVKWGLVFPLLFLLGFSSCNRCRDGCENGVCQKRECLCDLWWQGDACDYSLFRMYEGEYTGNDSCDDPMESVAFSLTVDEAIPNRMWINDAEFYIEFTDRTRFILPEQSKGGRLVSGEGEMLVEAISLSYIPSDSVSTLHCLIEATLEP